MVRGAWGINITKGNTYEPLDRFRFAPGKRKKTAGYILDHLIVPRHADVAGTAMAMTNNLSWASPNEQTSPDS